MFRPEHTVDIPAHHQIPVGEAVTTSAYGVMDPKTGMIMKSEPTQFRRAANDNKDLDISKKIKGYDEALDKWWNAAVERSNKLDSIEKNISKLYDKENRSEFESARLGKLLNEYNDLLDSPKPPYPLE